jgi:hypothetical protein
MSWFYLPWGTEEEAAPEDWRVLWFSPKDAGHVNSLFESGEKAYYIDADSKIDFVKMKLITRDVRSPVLCIFPFHCHSHC